MAIVAIALYGAWLVTGLAVRALLQLRRTGDSGLRAAGGGPTSARGWVALLFCCALAAGLAAPVSDLVTGGPFHVVRNPIYSAITLAVAGFTLMVPNVVAVISFVAMVVAIEVQVRVVEERYLTSVHGTAYTEYAGAVGRFLPGIGRMR